MNYTQIRALYTLVAEGSLAAAARAIGVSQPTLSQHLAALEAQSQVQIFEKSGRKLVLTEAGQRVFQAAEKVMQAARQVDDLMTGEGALTRGKLTLCSDSPSLAVELMHRFSRRHGEIRLTLRVASVHQVLSEVRDGLADVGIATDTPVGGDLVLRPLWRERLWVSLAAPHPLAAHSAVPLGDLGRETLLLREPGSRTRARIEELMQRAKLRPAGLIEIGDRAAIREAVARGLGLSLQSQSECAPDPRLAHRPIATDLRLDFVENIVVRRNYRGVQDIARFVDMARTEAPQIAAQLDSPGTAPWEFSQGV
ncbi:MAG: LysR substrate-binding domain-containing protein [Mangrovicoccus sp.]|nr:LysR substrate-binding domain-containing protein [Mangrovicoccus sp.]